jgi:hypothetical protein
MAVDGVQSEPLSSKFPLTGNITEKFRSLFRNHRAEKISMALDLRELPELVEVHFSRLGQAGEHRKLAKRIMQRRVTCEISGMLCTAPWQTFSKMRSSMRQPEQHSGRSSAACAIHRDSSARSGQHYRRVLAVKSRR